MNDMAGEGQEPWTELVRLYDQWKVIHRELVVILREAKPVLNADATTRRKPRLLESMTRSARHSPECRGGPTGHQCFRHELEATTSD